MTDSGPVTRKRARENKQQDQSKILKVDARTREDIAREGFIDRLLGPSKVDDQDTFCSLLDQNLLPASCPIMHCDVGIHPNDCFVMSGRCFSRTNLRQWVSQFKNKTDRPSCPITRNLISEQELSALGFSTSQFPGFTIRVVVPSIEQQSSIRPVDFSDLDSVTRASDIEVAVSIIRELEVGAFLVNDILAQKLGQDDCQTLLVVYSAFYATDSNFLPLWAILEQLGLRNIDWALCWEAIFNSSSKLSKKFKIVSDEVSNEKKNCFINVIKVLLQNADRDYLMAQFIKSLTLIPVNIGPRPKKFMLEIINALKDCDMKHTFEGISLLFFMSLQWNFPVSSLLQTFYRQIRAENGRKTIRSIWLFIAKFDRLTQTSLMDTYLCDLPADLTEVFVQEAIKSHSNNCALEFYQRFDHKKSNAERFYAQKTAIEFENVEFLKATSADFFNGASADQGQILLSIAAEFGSLPVVAKVFQLQHVTISYWLRVLREVPASRMDVFLHIWSLNKQNYLDNHMSLDICDQMEDVLLDACRNGKINILSHWIKHSHANLLQRYYPQMFLACCTSPAAHAVFKTLYKLSVERCPLFSLFFGNGVFLIRASNVGCHQIVEILVAELLKSRAVTGEKQDKLITTSLLATIRNAHRRAFFSVWNSFDVTADSFPRHFRDEIFEAARVCNDDFIKEILGV